MTRDEFKKLLIKAQDTGFDWYTPEALAEHVMKQISAAGLAVVPREPTTIMLEASRDCHESDWGDDVRAAIKAGDLLGEGK